MNARVAHHVAAMFLTCSAPAFAQSSLQLPLQFDLLNPGARSLALGSAFTGLADDATAGFSNPAGLTILQFPEISLEGRFRRVESASLAGGRLAGTVTNRGIDTMNGPQYESHLDTSAGPSFISIVYPRAKWAIAGYRHEFVRVTQSFKSNGVFQDDSTREQALKGDRELMMNAYGLSVAYRPASRIRLGASVALYTAKMNAQFLRYDPPDFFAAPNYASETFRSFSIQRGSAVDSVFSAGGLFTIKQGSDAGETAADLVLGIVYRQSGNFDFLAYEEDLFQSTTDARKNPTETLSIGLSSHATGSLTWALDATHVRYSSLLSGYIGVKQPADGVSRFQNFILDDVTELHAGIEYVLPLGLSPAVRAGAWHDPNHLISYRPPSNPDQLDRLFAAYLPVSDDLIHLTFGIGLALSSRYEINAAIDRSARTRVLSVSTVIRLAH